jgi:mRNA interferase HigB
MTIVGMKILEDFKAKHVEVATTVDAWVTEICGANWSKPAHIKQRYVAASFLKDNQVVFNLKGNQYRLLVRVSYETQVVLIKKVGTHSEYMDW